MPLPAGHPPFSSFSSFHRVRAAKPLFYWLECRFVIFAIFVKTPLFLAGQKHGLPKAPFSGPRRMSRDSPPNRPRDTSEAYRPPNSFMCSLFLVFSSPYCYDLCGHLQRRQMPDIENSRKTAEKGAEWVTVKQPKNSRKNSRKTVKTAVFWVFRLFSRLFFGRFTVTHSAPFSAVFRLF